MKAQELKQLAVTLPLEVEFKKRKKPTKGRSQSFKVFLPTFLVWVGEVFQLEGTNSWMYEPKVESYIGAWPDKIRATQALIYALGEQREKDEKCLT